jgi:hypothetical protein
MIASAVVIHVVIRLSDVTSLGRWSKCSLPLPVVLLVCSFNVLIFSVSWSRFLLFLSFFLSFFVFPYAISHRRLQRLIAIGMISRMTLTLARGYACSPFSIRSVLITAAQSALILPFRR